jgi:dihydropteroate synthase
MGVVNVTPDSFSDGGRYFDPDAAIARGLELAAAGADLLDVGGESTRPGATPVALADERARVLPVVGALAADAGVPVSVDTTKAAVAVAALDAGATIVNDVSAGLADPDMLSVVAAARAGYVAMHMRGEPRTMQREPVYGDLIGEIRDELAGALRMAEERGVRPEQLLVDPGIGFGKTVAHNLEILRRLAEFSLLGRPLVIGCSRKSFIGAVSDLPPGERLEGTLAAHVAAVLAGAHVVRVHDVAAHRRALALADAILDGRPEN